MCAEDWRITTPAAAHTLRGIGHGSFTLSLSSRTRNGESEPQRFQYATRLG
jgi:hypothetical protein